MTIKETKNGDQAYAGEPDIVFSTDQAHPEPSAPTTNAGNTANEPEIPLATATLLPETSMVQPSVAGSTFAAPATQEYSSSNTTTHPPASASTVVTQQVHQHPTGQGTPIPVGARWITVKHIGGVTWTLCAIISTITCCIVLCPCGLWAFACPCDEIRAYEVNGQVYDEHGRPLGHISKLRVLHR